MHAIYMDSIKKIAAGLLIVFMALQCVPLQVRASEGGDDQGSGTTEVTYASEETTESGFIAADDQATEPVIEVTIEATTTGATTTTSDSSDVVLEPDQVDQPVRQARIMLFSEVPPPTLSSDATLSDLSVPGFVFTPVFASSTLQYTVLLRPSYATGTGAPVVFATTTHANATYTMAITPFADASGTTTATTTIVVTAEDGTTTATTTVVFMVDSSITLGTDASLSELSVPGFSLSPSFPGETDLYTVELPFNYATSAGAPLTLATTSDPFATYATTTFPFDSASGTTTATTTIVVTSEDGNNHSTTTIRFIVLPRGEKESETPVDTATSTPEYRSSIVSGGGGLPSRYIANQINSTSTASTTPGTGNGNGNGNGGSNPPFSGPTGSDLTGSLIATRVVSSSTDESLASSTGSTTVETFVPDQTASVGMLDGWNYLKTLGWLLILIALLIMGYTGFQYFQNRK